MSLLRAARSATLSVVRQGRPVAWVPEWMGLGNLLYMGFWAWEGRSKGQERRVLLHPKRSAAVEIFPRLRDQIFLERNEVRFTDQRIMPWSGDSSPRPDFISAETHAPFINELLLPNSSIFAPPLPLEGALVVNVRRGDYYSVGDHQDEFGMDQVAYIQSALNISLDSHGVPERIVVISDGLPWCREALDKILSSIAPTVYAEGGIAHDLGAIVHAERLIITNSTFSYWGGYIGDVLRPDREVIAPWFFSRSQDGGRASQLRPYWTAVQGDFY